MTIATAVEVGGYVYVYDAKGAQLCALPTGNESADGLKGYTGSTVSVRRGDFVYIHDESGRQISAVPAR